MKKIRELFGWAFVASLFAIGALFAGLAPASAESPLADDNRPEVPVICNGTTFFSIRADGMPSGCGESPSIEGPESCFGTTFFAVLGEPVQSGCEEEQPAVAPLAPVSSSPRAVPIAFFSSGPPAASLAASPVAASPVGPPTFFFDSE